MIGLDVHRNEHGSVRVFAVNGDADIAEALQDPANLSSALGVDALDQTEVEIFPASNLTGLGLSGYLVDGLGMPDDQIDPDRTRLDALDGYILLVRAKAFGGAAQNLAPSEQLTFIGGYAEDTAPFLQMPIASEAARPGTGAQKIPPRAAREKSRRAGATFFAIVMALVVIVVVLLIF